MDQHKEEEEKNTQESMDQHEEEEEEDKSSEEGMASSPFPHPCSLLQYIVQACACCLGLRDSFSDATPAATAALAPPPPQEEDKQDRKTSYLYVQVDGVSAQDSAPSLVSRPRHRKTPEEGIGGNGGVHH